MRALTPLYFTARAFFLRRLYYITVNAKESAFIKNAARHSGHALSLMKGTALRLYRVKPYPVYRLCFCISEEKAYTGTQRYTGEWREVYTFSHTVVITHTPVTTPGPRRRLKY